MRSALAQRYRAEPVRRRIPIWLWIGCLILLAMWPLWYSPSAWASSQHHTSSSKSAAEDLPGSARFVRDEKGVSIIEFTGEYGIDLVAPRKTVAQEFFRTHADVYDFLVVFSSFEFPTVATGGGHDNEEVLAFHRGVRNDVKGIGIELFDNSLRYGSQGVLQSYVDMAAVTRWSNSTADPKYDLLLSVFAHEVQHRWGAFVKFRDWNGKVSTALLGKDGAHWSSLLDTQASVLYGANWRDNGDGTFTATATTSTYSPLDLYLSGLIDKSKVPPLTLIESSDLDPEDLPPPVGTTIRGIKRTVTIEDIIAVEGPRIPSADVSQKSFRFGFVYLVRPGETIDPTKLDVVAQARRQVGLRFNALTHGVGTANVFAEPPSASLPGGPSTVLPSLPPATNPGQNSAGLAWLKSQQKPEGSFMDAAGLAPRDTLLARSYLRAVDPVYGGLGPATSWISGQQLQNTDFLARKLIESSAGERSPSDLAALAALRNTDGGWGLGAGLRSNPLDTALALLASRLANVDQNGLKGAVDLLLAWQNADGGWGNAAASPSRVHVTAQALKALGGIAGVEESAAKARAFVKSRQNADGGFGDGASSIHETAHALLAMNDTGFGAEVNQTTAQRFVAENQRLDGSWQGSVYSTVLALQLMRNAAAPNLAISALQALPLPVHDGQRVTLSAKVTNAGSLPSQPSTVRFFDGDPTAGGLAIGEAVPISALVSGDSRSVQVVWNTTGRGGQRTVYAGVDFEQSNVELTRQDNVTSLNLKIEGANPRADLLLADGDVLATPSTVSRLPAEIKIQALVSNAGLAAVSNAKAVLWSGTGAARKRMEEATFSVAARATTGIQFNTTLTESGTTVYTVELDPDGLLDEASRSNNSASVTVKTTGGISLAVAATDIGIVPKPPKPGSDVVFTVGLRNDGTQDSTSFNVRYSIRSGATTTPLLTNVVQIEAGASVEQSIPWRAGQGGSYSFIVEMDPEKTSGDTDIADNTATLAFTVSATAGLNLAVSYRDIAFAPTPALEGENLALSALVRNTGDVDATGFEVEFYDGDPNAGGTIIGSSNVAALPAGGSKTVSINWLVPTSSERLVFVLLDRKRTQASEGSLEDNVAFTSLKVVALPDFAISQGALSLTPRVPRPGEATQLEVTVANLGEQGASGLVVSVFRGSPTDGIKLASDGVIPTLAAKASASIQFSFDAPAAAGTTTITVVVNPQFAIKERVRDNNAATVALGTQEGNFSVSEPFISPDGDGVKDNTILTYRLVAAAPVTVAVLDEQGRVLRASGTRASDSSGAWSWDGLDGEGRLVQDGRYELVVRNADGVVLGGATVEVDTNRSSLLGAIGTAAAVNAGLTCGIPQVSDVRSILDGAGFFLNVPSARDPAVDLPAGIYRQDDWGRGTRMVLSGPLDTVTGQPRPWDIFVANTPGTRLVAYDWTQRQLLSAGGEGEGRRVISTRRITQLIDLIKNGEEVLVQPEEGGLLAINTETGAHRILTSANIYNIKVSPDKRRLVGNTSSGELWLDLDTGRTRELSFQGEYYWSPKGVFVVVRQEGKLLLLDSNGDHYGEVNTTGQNGREAWSEDSSELYLPTSSGCRVTQDRVYSQCVSSLYRIDTVSGVRTQIQSISERFDISKFSPTGMGVDLAIVPGRYELLAHLFVLSGEGRRGVLRNAKADADGDFATTGSEYRLIDLRAPNAMRTIRFDQVPPPDETDGYGAFSQFIEYGRALQYRSTSNPTNLPACDANPDRPQQQTYAFRTLANMQTDLVLSRRADGVSVRIHGGISDKHFARYWLEYASEATPNVWHPIIAPSTTPVWGKDLANWITPGVGRYIVRLNVEDLAGNRKSKLRRVTIGQAGPPITNVVREPAFFSPNGDGANDDMRLSYRVLESVNLEFSIFNRQGALVRTISRNHPVAGVDAAIVWDGRDDNGRVVVDGEYRINVVGFDFFVTVDNSAPTVHALRSGEPFAECRGISCRVSELRWSVSDVNFDSVQLEVGEGAAPNKWRPYQRAIRLSNNLIGTDAVYLPLSEYVGHRYRLVATDLAGNRTVAQFDPPVEKVQVLSMAQILSRDLQRDELTPHPGSEMPLKWKWQLKQPQDMRPAAGIALMFAESLNDPIVSVSVQFNETALAEKGEWLEQPNMQVYPLLEGEHVPFLSDNAPGASFPLGAAGERSSLDEGSSVPQNYGMVAFSNPNIPADQGVRLRLKLVGRSGVEYLTNQATVLDTNLIDIEEQLSSDLLSGRVRLKTVSVARKLEVFISSTQDQYFAIERKILDQELNSVIPKDTFFGIRYEGRYVSCANYQLRAVATLESGQELTARSTVSNCGGVEFAVRPNFGACDAGAPGQLHGYVTPVSLRREPLLSLEVYAITPLGGRTLVFNVVNPSYQPYEFTWSHSGFPEGMASLEGITTDRDGVQRKGTFSVPVDRTPATLRITYPQEGQRVCAAPEWHRRGMGLDRELVNVLRPVAEIDDSAGFDYLLEFRRDDEDAAWQSVRGNLPSLKYPDPLESEEQRSAASPYELSEYSETKSGGRPYMSRQRIAGELGPIINFSGSVAARVTAFDWSGAKACRQVSFYLDGTVDVGPAAVDRRLFSPGTSSSLHSVFLTLTPLEPLSVTVNVRRIVTVGGAQAVEEGYVRRLANRLSVPAALTNLTWDGKDDAGNYVADGDYTFDITYEDGCGNTKAPILGRVIDLVRGSLRVQVDRTPPTLTLERPLAGEVTSSFLDILGSAKDKNLQQWTLEYRLDSEPDSWTLLASSTTGIDARKLATLNTTFMQGVVTLRLRATDKVELASELTRDLRLKPHTELIKTFSAQPTPFSPNGDGRRESLVVAFDVIQAVSLDLAVKRGSVVVRRLLTQSPAVPGLRQVTWDGRDDAMTRLADGPYTVEIKATSTTDETHSQTEELMVLLDNTPPLFTLDPALQPYLASNAVLRGSIADLTLTDYQIYVEGPLPGNRRVLLAEGSELLNKQALGTLEPMGLDDARYRIRVSARDEAENSLEYVSSEFELDSVAPVVALSNPTPGTFVSRVRPADIAGQVDDRNLFSVDLKIGGATAATPAVVGNPTTLSFTFDGAGVADGAYPIQLIGTDKAGNVGIANGAIHVDNTPPLAEISFPAANAAIGTMVPVVGTASDANMEVWKLELGSGVGQSIDSLTVIARGTANVANAEMTKLVGLPPDGPATLRLTVQDKGGNISTFDVPLQIDATPPNAPVLSGQREQRSDVRLSWTHPNEAGRIVGYHLYRNGVKINPSVLTAVEYQDKALLDGAYTYTVTAVSRSGVESVPSNAVRFDIKATGPFVQITRPAANTSVSGLVSIDGSAYAVTNFRSYQVAVSAEAEPTKWTVIRTSAVQVRGDVLATWSTAGLPEDAVYKIRLTADDVQGGVSETLVTVSIDNVAPAKPQGLKAQLSGPNDVQLSWSPNTEPDLAGYLLYRDNQLVNQKDPSDNSLVPYLLTGTSYLDKSLPDGTFVYTLVAMDKAGNTSESSAPASVLVETRAPQAVIVQPLNGAQVDGVTYVRAESKDLDVASVRFEYKHADASAWNTISGASTKAPYSVNWNTQGLADGSYQLRAVATDFTGNTDPAPVIITVVRKNLQRPLPPSDLTALVDGAVVSLSWTASASSNVRGYHVQRTDASGESVRVTSATVAGTAYVDAGLSDGRYTYQVLAVNADDNESDPAPEAAAVVYTTRLKQPYTPLAQATSPLKGSTPNATIEVGVASTSDAGVEQSLTLAPDNKGDFASDTVPLAMGANTISARQTDPAGNRSRAGRVRVARGDLPAAPGAVQVTVSGNTYHATWSASTSADVAGYVVRVDGKDDPRPLNFVTATATSVAGSYASAERAIDPYDYTAWMPDGADSAPSIELATARKELVTELSIAWSQYTPPPSDYAVEAWDGYVWVPLKEASQNTELKLQLPLSPPYYTDRIRITLPPGFNGNAAAGIGDVRAKSLEVVAGTAANLVVPDGRHTVSVRSLSTLGLLGNPTDAAPTPVGDVTPPPPVVVSAAVSGAMVTVSWTESVATDLARYEVLRNGTVVASVPGSAPRQHVDGPLANGVYSYTVRPIDQVGNVGGLSNEAIANIASATPGTPRLLSVEAPRTGGELRLSWMAPTFGTPVSAYAAYRSTTAGGPYVLLGTTSSDTLVYSDVPVANGVRHYYVVRARDVNGVESEPSNEANGVASDQSAPAIFYPTSSDKPISTFIGSTPVRMFSEPAARVELSRDGVSLGSVIALANLHSTSVYAGSGTWEPAPVADLVANVHNGKLSIWRVIPTLDGSTNSTLVHSVPLDSWSGIPTWSPDGSQVAVPSGYTRTTVVRAASGIAETSAFAAPVDQLAWHPDGKRWIATVNGTDIVEVEVETGVSRVIGSAVEWPSRLSISPDGEHLAYLDGSHLSVLSLADGNTQRATGPQPDVEEPLAWAGDGRSVYFLGKEAGDPLKQLYRLPVSESSPQAVTDHPGGVDHFAVSPSGAPAFLSGNRLHAFNADQVSASSFVGEIQPDVRLLKWARSGVLFAEDAVGLWANLLPGTAVFPPIALKPGQNSLSAKATGVSGKVGQASAISVTYVTQSSALPDLSVQTSDVMTFPLVPQQGASARITLVVNNLGQAAAADAGVRVLATSPTGTRVDLLNARTTAIAAGASQVFRVDTVFDAAGEWQLSVAVDAAEEVEESSEDNNRVVVPVRVVSPTSARSVAVNLDNSAYKVGTTLSGGVTIFNGQADISGQLQLAIEDEQGQSVATLPTLPQPLLSYGQSRTVEFTWQVPSIYDGPYKVRAVWVSGGSVLAQSTATFLVRPHVHVSAKVNSDSSSYPLGTTARIVAQVDPAGTSPTISSADVSLRVFNAAGTVVLDTSDSVGLVTATQLVKQLSTAGLAQGVYTVELRVSVKAEEVATATASFVVVAPTVPTASLDGDIVLERASAVHTGVIAGTAILRNTGGADLGAFQYEVAILDPRTNAVLARAINDVTSLSSGSETRSSFSFSALGMPVGTLWIQLRTSLAVQRAAVKNGPSPNLLRQREFSLFELDPPTVNIKQPVDGAHLRAAQSVQVAASDLLSGVRSVEFKTNVGAWTGMMLSDPVSSTYSGVLPALPDGVHQVQARATDNSGNLSAPVQTSFVIDSVAPVIAISGVSETAYTGPVTPLIEVTDLNLWVSHAQLNGADFASGTTISQPGAHVLQVDAIDRAGNAASRTIRFTISTGSADTTPPVIDIKTPQTDSYIRRGTTGLTATVVDAESLVAAAEFSLDGGGFAPMAIDGAQGTPDLYSASLDALADGAHSLTVRARDVHGNESSSPLRRFTVDNTPPVITVSGVAAGQYSTSVTPVVSVTDAALQASAITLNGVAYVSGTPVSENGDYLLSVSAIDRAGNDATASLQFSVRVPAADTTPPVLFIEHPGDGAHIRAGAALTVSATDAGSGVAGVEHRLDAQSAWAGMSLSTTTGKHTADVGSLPDGAYSAFVRATDHAGNTSGVQERRFVVDNTAPVVLVSGVADGGQYPGSANVSVTVSDTHLGTMSAMLNGSPYVSGSAVSTAGSYTLVVAARDIAGNETIVSIQFRITSGSVQAPVVTIVSPTANAVVKSGSLLAASVQPMAGVSRLEFATGASASYAGMQAKGSGMHEALVPQQADGPLTLRVRAVDTQGVPHADTVRTITVDNTPPVIDQRSVSDGATYPAGQMVTFRATDVHLDTVTSTLDGLPFSSGQRVVAPGRHELQIVARDRAGNETRQVLVFTTTAAAVSQQPVPVPLSMNAALLTLMSLAMVFLASRSPRTKQKK